MLSVSSSSFEGKLFYFIKRVLIINISNARNVFIRLPLKLMVLILVFWLKFLFGRFSSKSQQTINTSSSPQSSISVVLDHDPVILKRKSILPQQNVLSVVKSTSQSSLVNYFTPDYIINPIDRPESPIDLDVTDLDCDSMASSFYYDLKTQFSSVSKNADMNSSFSYYRQEDHFNNDKINNGSGLPDLINQKGNKDVPTDKARKYLEGLDGVKFNEIQVPDTLKKQLEYFDRDELLQLIAYQKKYLDFKETRIKDLENYIDNLVVKIIETEPLILMNASNVLTKSKNVI